MLPDFPSCLRETRIVLDSELDVLRVYLKSLPLDFLGARACALATELAEIIAVHLEGSAILVGYDFREEDEF